MPKPKDAAKPELSKIDELFKIVDMFGAPPFSPKSHYAELWGKLKAEKDALEKQKADQQGEQEKATEQKKAQAAWGVQQSSSKSYWGALSKKSSGGYAGPSTCWRCGVTFTSKDSWKVWPQGPTCLPCRTELETKKGIWYEKGKIGGNFEGQQKPLPKDGPMKNGEIRKVSASVSPLWTDQWMVMGTAKAPYIVSKKTKSGEWQCSCPDWTKHTPRTDCKHILKVKLQEGVLVVKEETIFTTKKTTATGNQGLALNPAPKGRKFR